MKRIFKYQLTNPESNAAAVFRWLQKSFYGPKIIYITIANGSFTVLYYMIFDCSKGRCNISLERKVEE